MVCHTCGLDNDPAAVVCARCNSALTSAPAVRRPPQTRTGPSRIPLIAGVSVLLVALAVAVGIYMRPATTPQPTAAQPTTVQPSTTEPSTTEPSTTEPGTAGPSKVEPTTKAPDPVAQLAAIDAVLSDSVASRRKLNQAIEQVGECDDLSGAVADIRAVGDERRSQMETVRTADLSALADAEALRSGLMAALQYAYEADQGFLAWAEPTLTGGCGAADDAGYARGRAASTSAGAAKRAFLTRWNPVAEANGLRARSADDI